MKRISDIKNFYLEDFDGNEVRVNSLQRACELAVDRHDVHTLIHIGGYNLDYYRYGDTVETLYNRCVEIIHKI
jgi:hypothetical protein